MRRKAFTMIELIFVIVVIGIIAKFGVEFLIQAYNGYIFSAVQNKLQTQTETALEQIANRLQYRIKSSIIVRDDNNNNFANNFRSLANANNLGHETILEWVGYDIDGLRGNWNGTMYVPTWSGFIDLAGSTPPDTILSPMTQDTNITTMINALSGNPLIGVAQSAIFFIGGNSDINGFGWDGNAITDQSKIIHPIHAAGSNITPAVGSFSGVDIYEYYQLAWTAYALVWNGTPTSSNTAYIGSLDDNTTTDLFKDVLPSPLKQGTQNGQWRRISANNYVVKADNTDINFTYYPNNGSFTCTVDNTPAGQICKRLTH
ncbi:MAG: prepilin-type N-terminal cleavage/methylation domain-containing protein [Thiovulaceae bacterium]|nr:prepilin-type N-terminal cleavage/methylation domain-containing protein [Sulfurimonadaceae bacterium]